jgi:hypothetical protein
LTNDDGTGGRSSDLTKTTTKPQGRSSDLMRTTKEPEEGRWRPHEDDDGDIGKSTKDDDGGRSRNLTKTTTEPQEGLAT